MKYFDKFFSSVLSYNNFLECPHRRNSAIAFFVFLFAMPLISSDVTHYKNEFSQVTAMYDSENYGLIILNSTGVYSVDKTSGTASPVLFRNNTNGDRTHVFEFNKYLYCFKEGGSLHKINDGISDSVAKGVIAYHIRGDKLYLIKSREPIVQIISKDSSISLRASDNDKIDFSPKANIIEIDDKIYAYTNVHKRLLFSIEEDSLNYLVTPTSSNYDDFCEFFPRRIYNVNDEIWFNTYNGVYKFSGLDIEPVDPLYNLHEFNIYDMYVKDQEIYGISEYGIFKTSIDTKQTEYLISKPVAIKNYKPIYGGKSKIIFYAEETLSVYNYETQEIDDYDNEDLKFISSYSESVEGDLLLGLANKIEWYESDEPRIFGGTGYYSNQMFDVTYDKVNKKIVTPGIIDEQFILQTFDGDKWDIIPIPYEFKLLDAVIISEAHVVVDSRGYYYFAYGSYFAVWDGEVWDRKNLITDTNLPYPAGRYNVLTADSSDGVWVAGYIMWMSEELKYQVGKNVVFRFENDNYEVIEDSVLTNSMDYFKDGICLSSGEIVLNTHDGEIYYYKDGEGELIVSEDGEDPILTDDGDTISCPNTQRILSENKNHDLVVSYTAGWYYSSEYGMITYKGGISTYDGESWEHDHYTEIAKKDSLEMLLNRVIYDSHGDEYLLTHNKLIRISDGATEVVLSEGFNIQYFSHVVIVDDIIWISENKLGMYQVPIPVIDGVKDEPGLIKPKLLRHEMIVNDRLELITDIRNWEIYSSGGRKVSSGQGDKFIDISNLGAGVYFLVCDTYGKPLAQKFVVSR